MDGLKPPAQWSMDSVNLSKAWRTWKEEFTLYTELALPDAEEKARVKLFYYLIGERGRELCGTLIGAESRVTVSELMKKIDEHCNPKVNETVERYRFFARNQAPGENIDKYVTDLRMLASTCNFGQLKDSLIRDRIVCGTNSSSWRERLLREENLTLERCLDICRAMEILREYNKTIAGQAVEELHAVKQKERKRLDKEISCRFCGRAHERLKSKCPAYGKKCKKCGKENHFAIACRSKSRQSENGKKVHTVTEQDSDSCEDIMTVTAMTETAVEVNQIKESDMKKREQLFAGMMIGNSLVKFQVDCGATCNVIPINLLNPNIKMEHTDKVLVMYNKSRLCPLGKCNVKLTNPRNNKKYRVEFQVVEEDCKTPLLGRTASEAMKLIQVRYDNICALDSSVTTGPSEKNTWSLEEIKTEFQDVFTGDGCLQGEYELEIDTTVQPVKLPKRRVPVSMMKPLKGELMSLADRQIIAPVECSTDWISGMVTVQKPNGKPRICIDPRPLNKALKRSHFPLPTIDDILPDVSKAKVFTVCDVKHGFWHVKLTEESSHLTTFATPFGRFRWLRMPMGISPAPEVFQRKLMQALENLPGTYIIADDILITGKGETTELAEMDQDRNLRLFLGRCRERNIKLNVEKLKLRRQEVPYIGHLLTAEGLRADPEKVRAIAEMPAPTDIKGVQRLVGMVNYLSKFYKHLSDDCEPLRQLTHRDSLWEWTDVQEDAFKRLKEKLTQVPVLKYYSPEEELTLQCDASETGLGAALTQHGKPVAFASRALTLTERGYAQIEKECLAIVFGMEKFHQYTYGRLVRVQSDHKPLENIIKKPLLHAPKRLQRMLLRLQKYDITITYVPGRDMLLADTLSRAYLQDSIKSQTELETECVNMVDYVPVSTESMDRIRAGTRTDHTLQTLIKTIQKGWPACKKVVPVEITQFQSLQDELSTQDGLVFKGERVVIPQALQPDITQRIHSTHIGTEGCLRRATDCVYWHGMNDHIKKYIATCDICRSVDAKQQKETLKPHEPTTRPWTKVGTDLFNFEGRDYLITVDYYSNFWEIDYLPDTKSSTVIRKLKAHFARQGIPNIVFSDNGPQYSSTEFANFSRKWEFQHHTSSPGYPQSNGKAESAGKTAKRLMKKAKLAGQDPYLALLDHRNTPTQGLTTSPAQRLLSRRTRTLLPIGDRLLQPKVTDNKVALMKNRERQTKYYNRMAKDMDTLNPGDLVRVQPFEPHTLWCMVSKFCSSCKLSS
ncbi:unnamed protein product [Oreochromis niloticus]|nr:unnamed protein product [Mustela putorius furo]